MAEALVKKESTSVVLETPEELARKEIELQAEDWEKARVEVENQEIVPKPPFYEIRLHEGVGPLAYETARGLVKVWSGEYILLYRYETGELYSDGTPIFAEDFLIVTEKAMEALQLAMAPGDLPISLSRRAAELGRERRGDPPHPNRELPGPRPNPFPFSGGFGGSANPIGGPEPGKYIPPASRPGVGVENLAPAPLRQGEQNPPRPSLTPQKPPVPPVLPKK
jgi:hypothetical protein